MKVLLVFVGIMVWVAPLMAETYSWVDQNGTWNFTEDYSRVPKKYRKNVNMRGDAVSEPVYKEPSREVPGPVDREPVNEPAEKKSGSSFERIGGKSYAEWKQDFSEREAAMASLRKRIEGYDVELKKPLEDTPDNQKLASERNNAAQQYLDMRKQYDQQLEAARKAGINIDAK
jgi:hypothetical protein